MISLHTGIVKTSSLATTKADETSQISVSQNASIQKISGYQCQILSTSPISSKASQTPALVLPVNASRIFKLEK